MKHNTKTQHTPGPWFARHVVGNHWQVYGNSPHCAGLEQTICDINGPWEPENYKSNAQLLSQAPALLAACEELLACAWPTEDKESRTGKAIEKATLAIAKAKGEA